MVVIGQEAKKKIPSTCVPWATLWEFLPPPAPPKGAFIWKQPCWEGSCKPSNCSHYPRTVRIQWFAHLWGDWRRMLKSFACIKQVNFAALLLLLSSYSSANSDAEDWVNWTSGQILWDTWLLKDAVRFLLGGVIGYLTCLHRDDYSYQGLFRIYRLLCKIRVLGDPVEIWRNCKIFFLIFLSKIGCDLFILCLSSALWDLPCSLNLTCAVPGLL